jgi:hypothetical protein
MSGDLRDTRAGPDAAAADWDRFVGIYLEEHLAARPTFAVAAGRHDFDGQLPDWSPPGIAAEISRLRRARATAAQWAMPLDAARDFERRNLLARIDAELYWLDEAELPRRNPLFYSDALDPSVYLSRDYAPPAERLRAYRRYLEALPDAIAALRANLAPPLPAPFAELARQNLAGLAEFCDQAPAAWSSLLGGGDPGLGAPTAAATRALNAAAEAFASEQKRALRDPDGAPSFRLGAAGLARLLAATEQVTVPLADIERAGRRELERNQAALAEAAAAWAPGLSVADCMARLLAAKPADGPVACARRQVAELRRFLDSSELVTVPAEVQARVEVAPPHQRWNSAYIDIPGRCRRSTTSRHPIHGGARPSAKPTSRAKRTCSTSAPTRCGPVTSSSSCIPIGWPRQSAGCSSATGLRRDGRTTPRR